MKRVFNNAMKYRFKLNDISKYSGTLNTKDTSWKFLRSATGKYTPWVEDAKKIDEGSVMTEEPEKEEEDGEDEEESIDVDGSGKEFDWSRTMLYKLYAKHGRWMHQDENIFSDTECKILHSHFKKVGNFDEEFN